MFCSGLHRKMPDRSAPRLRVVHQTQWGYRLETLRGKKRRPLTNKRLAACMEGGMEAKEGRVHIHAQRGASLTNVDQSEFFPGRKSICRDFKKSRWSVRAFSSTLKCRRKQSGDRDRGRGIYLGYLLCGRLWCCRLERVRAVGDRWNPLTRPSSILEKPAPTDQPTAPTECESRRRQLTAFVETSEHLRRMRWGFCGGRQLKEREKEEASVIKY